MLFWFYRCRSSERLSNLSKVTQLVPFGIKPYYLVSSGGEWGVRMWYHTFHVIPHIPCDTTHSKNGEFFSVLLGSHALFGGGPGTGKDFRDKPVHSSFSKWRCWGGPEREGVYSRPPSKSAGAPGVDLYDITFLDFRRLCIFIPCPLNGISSCYQSICPDFQLI